MAAGRTVQASAIISPPAPTASPALASAVSASGIVMAPAGQIGWFAIFSNRPRSRGVWGSCSTPSPTMAPGVSA